MVTMCARCGRRKAKRSCVTLGSRICALCCGTAREREIRCAPSCRYLREHQPYQARRAMEKSVAAAEPSAGPRTGPRAEERLGWLAFGIRSALAGLARENPGFDDQDAVLALAEARERTVKPPSLLIVPGQAERRTSAAAAAIVKVLDTLRFESGVLVSSAADAYAKDEKVTALDALLAEIRRTAGAEPNGRAYLSALAAQLEQLGAAARRKVITPS